MLNGECHRPTVRRIRHSAAYAGQRTVTSTDATALNVPLIVLCA
jgi:hypothetical protein